MPTSIRVSFSGLCFLAFNTAAGEVQVLLPAPDMMQMANGMPMEKHFADLYVDEAYFTGDCLGHGMRRYPLSGDLDLSTLAASPIDVSLPTGLPDLSARTQQTVAPGFLAQPIPPKLQARVKLSSGGIADYAATRELFFAGTQSDMPWKIGWVIRNAVLTPPNPQQPLSTVAVPQLGLSLIPVNDVVELHVKNVVAAERVPGDAQFQVVPSGTQIAHFQSYYQLLGFPPANNQPCPIVHPAGVGQLGSYITCTVAAGRM